MKRLFLLPVLAACGASAGSPEREPVDFSVTWPTAYGRNIYVVGDVPDLGGWDPLRAVKLRWTEGSVWTGRVAVRKGSTFAYKFIARNGDPTPYCDANNVLWEPGGNRTGVVEAAPAAPYNGKTLFYYSGWTQASLIYRSGTNWFDAPMTRVGEGRTPDEQLYRIDGIGEAGDDLEFIPHGRLDGVEAYDHAPYGGYGDSNYYSFLDVMLLQDGQLFTYWPGASVSAARIETRWIDSSVSGLSGRTARIYLPRGYDDHPDRRYPVFYLHDGQNVFDPGGAFGSWSADATATREISQGRMRECILVAVDNTSNRQSEYGPPGDTYPGAPPGRADAYVRFLLDNVHPTIDTHYRTLTDRRNTYIGGSSMGGLVSLYAAYETNRYGGVLAMSPAVTRATNYTASLWGRPQPDLRVYLDTGSAEGNVGPGVGDYWHKPWEAYDILLAQGFAPNGDMLMRIGCGAAHNEAAWKARLPEALRFLLDPRDAPNELAMEAYPPRLSWTSDNRIRFQSQARFAYELESASNLTASAWNPVASAAAEEKPWNERQMTSPPPGAASAFYRIAARPAP